MHYDVIVIGAGLAGLMAAEAAQQEGARVLLFAKGMGSLPLVSGGVDGLGYFPAGAESPVASPLDALSGLAKAHPEHPYARLGEERILSALACFQEMTRLGGMPYTGSFHANILIPTTLGTFRPTCLVPATMKKGDLSRAGQVLLLSFEGLKDFSPRMAAENLNLLQSQGKIAPSFRPGNRVPLDVSGRPLNALFLADAFDEAGSRRKMINQLKRSLKKEERLGLPAVLGVRRSYEVWMEMEKGLGVEIFEMPTPPPSVPGLRLHHLLQSRLQQKGVRILIGLAAAEIFSESGRIKRVALGGGEKGPIYTASALVLATGKFFGGGLDSVRGRIFETLLDLPLIFPSQRQDWFRSALLTPDGQPLNSFGVEVNPDLQPVDRQGQVVYSNLFAAGGILAHGDSMAEKSGGGVAIATGYWAGKFAADRARRNQ
jgi:glycerol-3-phosphate dehydrogenase subunit B